MTEKKTKTGRPQGAKTADRQPIEIRYQPCRKCGCATKPVNSQIVHEGEASGENDYGKYRYFWIWAADCAKCGAKLKVYQYDYIEVKEPAKA